MGDPGLGLDRKSFLALVEDPSDAGIFCTNEELRRMLPKQGPDTDVSGVYTVTEAKATKLIGKVANVTQSGGVATCRIMDGSQVYEWEWVLDGAATITQQFREYTPWPGSIKGLQGSYTIKFVQPATYAFITYTQEATSFSVGDCVQKKGAVFDRWGKVGKVVEVDEDGDVKVHFDDEPNADPNFVHAKSFEKVDIQRHGDGRG